MARRPTGEVRWSGGIPSAYVRVAPGIRRSFKMPPCRTEDEARERAALVAELARRCRLAGLPELSWRPALEGLAAAPARDLPAHRELVEAILGGQVVPLDDLPTFGEVGEQWVTGKLHRLFPDHVRAKDHRLDASRLGYLVDLDVGGVRLGDLRIDRVTLEHAESAMRQLPERAKRPGTRRHYAQILHRVMALAVYPLRHIERNPLPEGFMPKVGRPPAFSYLYPDEDARLMGCASIPLARRLLWGFLAREGMRVSEALGLTWRDLDLVHGAITLDENKTDDPRAWALDAGVVRALRRFKPEGAEPGGLVFVDDGAPITPHGIARLLRADLKAAGIERPELFVKTASRQPFRVHDLRGTFVTLSLANGKTETWVADRTGHKSSAMINRYRRAARHAAELGLGPLAPLGEVLADCPLIALEPPSVDREVSPKTSMISAVPRDGIEPPTRGFSDRAGGAEQPRKPEKSAPADDARPPSSGTKGQSEGNQETPADPVEAALADALRRASEAGQWDTVAQLARELEARRRAHEAPGVVRLDERRARKS